MTIAPEAPPAYQLCHRQLHVMSPENVYRRPDGCVECGGCKAANRKDQLERAKERMLNLLTTFTAPSGDDWYHQARCQDLGANPQLFDLADATTEINNHSVAAVNARRHQEAREYCEFCPVKRQCLGFALTNQETGTWGGELLTRDDWVSGRTALKEMTK